MTSERSRTGRGSSTANEDAHPPLPGEPLLRETMTQQERNALRVWTVLAIGLIAIALSVLYALA